MRSRTRRAAGLVPLCVLVCLSVWTVQSFAATARNVGMKQEAWYQASPADPGEDDPTCALPAGCAPQPGLPVNPFPENTLHVGVAGGRDTARTFLALDLTALPAGAFVTGGTLTLPVLADGASGSVQPETADIAACPFAGSVKAAQGGAPDEAPEYACETAAKARFKAGDQPTIIVDLAPIAALLSTGGVALVPSDAARESGATWRVVFPTRDHAAKEQITASLSYDPPASLDPLPPPPAPADTSSGDEGFSSGSEPFSSGEPFEPAAGPAVADVPAPVAADGVEQPIAAGPPAPAPVTPLAAGGYAYPAVWLAPLVMAAVAGLLARSLSGEITLPGPASGEGPGRTPNVIERVIAALRPPASPGSVAT